jgi:hypothetical protein
MDQPETDPVLRRRAQVLRLTSAGQRFGYTCFAAATVLFFVGLVAQFPGWLVTAVVVLLVAGSVVLLPSIIFSYAAKAADKEDRGEPFTY